MSSQTRFSGVFTTAVDSVDAGSPAPHYLHGSDFII